MPYDTLASGIRRTFSSVRRSSSDMAQLFAKGDSHSRGQEAVQTELIEAVNKRDSSKYQSIISLEMENPFLPFIRPLKEECSSWHTAAIIGATDILKHILIVCGEDAGSVIDIKDERNNKTALHFAAESGNIDTVRFLLVNGASPFVQTPKLWAPLHYASEYGHVEVVRLLLEHAADVDVMNESSQTPAHICAVYGHLTCFQILVER